MKSKIWVVAKKELIRFFSDKRMIFTVLLFPGLIMYIMYSLLGEAFQEQTVNDSYEYQVEIVGYSEELVSLFDNYTMRIITDETELEAEIIENKLEEGEIDAYVIIPQNFWNYVQGYMEQTEERNIPEIKIYYNSLEISSYQAYLILENVFQELENGIFNIFEINSNENIYYDIANKENEFNNEIASLLPMLLLVLSFAGCMGIATESIAGEKERGTIATVLVTPVKRQDIVLGKVVALAVISIISVCISSLCVFASLPNILNDDIDFSIYGVQTYFYLLLIMLSTILLIVVVIMNISAICNSVKEAHTATMPFMIVVMILGLSTLFNDVTKIDSLSFFIPIYNSAQSLHLILLGEFGMQEVVTIISNMIYACLGTFILTKLLKKERIIFSY